MDTRYRKLPEPAPKGRMLLSGSGGRRFFFDANTTRYGNRLFISPVTGAARNVIALPVEDLIEFRNRISSMIEMLHLDEQAERRPPHYLPAPTYQRGGRRFTNRNGESQQPDSVKPVEGPRGNQKSLSPRRTSESGSRQRAKPATRNSNHHELQSQAARKEPDSTTAPLHGEEATALKTVEHKSTEDDEVEKRKGETINEEMINEEDKHATPRVRKDEEIQAKSEGRKEEPGESNSSSSPPISPKGGKKNKKNKGKGVTDITATK